MAKTWLDKLNAQIKAVSEDQLASVQPKEPLCDKCQVAGVLDPKLQRLYFIINQHVLRTRQLHESIAAAGSTEEILAELKLHIRTGKFLYKIYEFSVRDAFPQIPEDEFFDLKEGWNVVWHAAPDVEDVLKGILLGGLGMLVDSFLKRERV